MSQASAKTAGANAVHTDESSLGALGRRLVTIPLYLTLCLVSVLAAPLWIPALAIVDATRSGTRSALRCGAFFTLYFQAQAAGLVVAFALWLVSGPWTGRDPARYVTRNQHLKWWWARTQLMGAARIFGIHFHIEGAEVIAPGPIVLLIRHASMGDTMLPAVFVEYPNDIYCKYVLKHELLWDPCIDVVANRLDCYFVRRESSDASREIQGVARLIENLADNQGFMIYPEGTRFTPEKREHVLSRLRERGDPELAARAEKLQHVLPPRLGGTLAALEKNPGADAILCAQTGCEQAATFSELWRDNLVDRDIHIKFWRVPFNEIPNHRAGRVEWLFDQWSRVDDWIDETQTKLATRS